MFIIWPNLTKVLEEYPLQCAFILYFILQKLSILYKYKHGIVLISSNAYNLIDLSSALKNDTMFLLHRDEKIYAILPTYFVSFHVEFVELGILAIPKLIL